MPKIKTVGRFSPLPLLGTPAKIVANDPRVTRATDSEDEIITATVGAFLTRTDWSCSNTSGIDTASIAGSDQVSVLTHGNTNPAFKLRNGRRYYSKRRQASSKAQLVKNRPIFVRKCILYRARSAWKEQILQTVYDFCQIACQWFILLLARLKSPALSLPLCLAVWRAHTRPACSLRCLTPKCWRIDHAYNSLRFVLL